MGPNIEVKHIKVIFISQSQLKFLASNIKGYTLAAIVLALAQFELVVSDLSESKCDAKHLLKALESEAFHLDQRRNILGSRCGKYTEH